MEVCIFGVLTVNLLTSSSECPLSRCLLKMAGEPWQKKLNALLQPVLRAYMMTGKRHK